MTNQETKEFFQRELEYVKPYREQYKGAKSLCEACENAINALEQQPGDDCISRAEVQKFVSYIQSIKDSHNEQDTPINYGTICDLVIRGWKLMELPSVTPTQSWIPLVWDEYPTVDSDGNDDYVYAVDYFVPMPKEDEWVLITDENHNVVSVQYDGYDFGDYARENILAWQPLPKPYEEKGEH